MMRQYLYRLRTFLRDKGNVFWTLAFPLLMATFFALAFGNLTDSIERFEAIPVAVVDAGEDDTYRAMLDALSEGDGAVLRVTEASGAEAARLLERGDVDGVIEAGDTVSLTLKADGVSQSILKNVLDGYLQAEATLQGVAAINPAQVQAAARGLAEPGQAVTHISLSGGSLDYMLQMFYSLVAMACLGGGFFGVSAAVSIQPGMSAIGLRRGVSPVRKASLVAGDFLAALTLVFGEICILLTYMHFVLGVSLGMNWPAIVLVCLLGAAAGVALGMFVGVAVPGKAGTKDGVIVTLMLSLSFLSGLMYYDMRAIIERTVPIVNRLNPAALIVDAFYALDAYGVGARFLGDMGLLAALVAVLAAGCILLLRRKQYVSV